MATTGASLKSFPSKEEVPSRAASASVVVQHLSSEVAHVASPAYVARDTLIPGLTSKPGTVEIVLFKTADSMADTLHELGGLWLVDLYSRGLSTTWLGEVIEDSVILSLWDLEALWVALPTERESATELVMPGDRLNKQPLLNCKSAILADLVGEVSGSTIDLCPNALSHLMGKCQLGYRDCAKGLGSATTKH